MPLFDYKCADCDKRFSLLLGVVAEHQEERCPSCGRLNVRRLISRFSRLRSEDDLIDDLADPTKLGDPDDPKQLHTWMKRMGREMGEDLGDDFDDLLNEAEESESGLEDVTC